MKNINNLYKKLIEKLENDENIHDITDELAEKNNIDFLVSKYENTENNSEKKILISIFYKIENYNADMQEKVYELFKKIIYNNIFLSEILDVIGTCELTIFQNDLYNLLKYENGQLKVYELDTLLYALGMIDCVKAIPLIKKHINSHEITIRNCAKKSLEMLQNIE